MVCNPGAWRQYIIIGENGQDLSWKCRRLTGPIKLGLGTGWMCGDWTAYLINNKPLRNGEIPSCPGQPYLYPC